MKKLLLITLTFFTVSITAATTYSMEAFQCNYVNGKGYSDVKKVLP